MKPIPVSSSDFPQIINGGCLYVDKTAYFHRLITDPNGQFFFLSRPRRFGKSLMLSTLEAIFQGRKELFEGLDISRTGYDWKIHPVIHLNLSYCASEKYNRFARDLPAEITRGLSEAGCQYNPKVSYATNFGIAIDTLARRGTPPVVLIDEYDNPVAKVLQDTKTAEDVRADLSALYLQLKDRVGKIRFLMLAGVSKFTKMSVFSALSNLRDISLDDEYSGMLGFTEEELERYYGEHMAAHAARMKLTIQEYRAELKRMYNGYRFWKFEGMNVYNPVSINMTLVARDPVFNCYWANTGRPSMLMNYLKREEILSIDPERVSDVRSADFDVTDLAQIPVKGLLYQAGYLTITDFNPYTQTYTLGIPDEEVRQDFAVVMASLCAKSTVSWASSLGVSLLLGEWKRFFEGLKALYAGVAYAPQEKHVCEYSYARCLAFLLQGQGIVCQQEMVQADGRSDMVCTHHCGIYIFELKNGQSADIAMDQIQRKEYASPYAADSRPVWLIGLSFDPDTRHLVGYAYERYR